MKLKYKGIFYPDVLHFGGSTYEQEEDIFQSERDETLFISNDNTIGNKSPGASVPDDIAAICDATAQDNNSYYLLKLEDGANLKVWEMV